MRKAFWVEIHAAWSVFLTQDTLTGVLRLLKVSAASRPSTTPPADQPIDALRAVAVAASSGDVEARRTLTLAIGPGVLRAVRGVLGVSHPDLEDVLQEALVAVHTALAGFRYECKVQHFASRVA